MFEQKAFVRQQNTAFNSQVDTNRYASVFDSGSFEQPSHASASHAISLADSFNQVSGMDTGLSVLSTPDIDFVQVAPTAWNSADSSWNQAPAWDNSLILGSSDFSGIRPAGLNLRNAWNSAKDKAKNADWKKIGHGTLDVVGALPIPVVSTAADLANAGWYAAEGDYKNAALSALGAAPGVGDGAKLALKAADAARTARAARTPARATARAIDAPPRPGVAPSPRSEPRGLAPSPKPSTRKPETSIASPRREASGRTDSNPVVAPARGSARRPDPSPRGAVKQSDPKRPDPQPSPAAAKKPEPGRSVDNPIPSGRKEQLPQRGTESSRTKPPQRSETPPSGRDSHLQETLGSVRPTGLERFTGAMNRAEYLSQRLDQINNHVDLFQQMQGGDAETGEPSAADFAFAAVDAFVGMRASRGGGGFGGRQNSAATKAGGSRQQSSPSASPSRFDPTADPIHTARGSDSSGGNNRKPPVGTPNSNTSNGKDQLQIEARPPRPEIEARSSRLEIEARPESERGTGHGHQRHGSHTRMFEQIRRIRTGIAPDGKSAPTRQATRFFSPEHEQMAVDKARKVVEEQPTFQVNSQGDILPLRATVIVDGPSRHTFAVNRAGETTPISVVSNTSQESFESSFRGYGDGFRRLKSDAAGNPKPLLTGIGPIHHSQVRDASGQKASVFVQRVEPFQRAKVIFDYNPATRKWDTVSQYPGNGDIGVTLKERRWPQ